MSEMTRFYTNPVDKLHPNDFYPLLKMAIEEDCPENDITSESIFSESDWGKASLISREDGILSGTGVLLAIQEIYGSSFRVTQFILEGQPIFRGDEIAKLEAPTRLLLRMERILLNFIQYLSGISSTVQKLVVQYPNLLILDTRKTLPGYRRLVKYAVYMGGGANHRIHLSDMALIKDNHIALCGSITKTIMSIRNKFPQKKIEIEIDTLSQLQEAISCSPDIIMLDNFSNQDTRDAINLIRSSGLKIRIECSGGVTPEKLKFLSEFGEIGVSMGYLTHTTRFMDIGLDIEY